MNAPTTFSYLSNSIRVITIEDQPWFLGGDVLKALYGSASGRSHHYDVLDRSEVSKVKRIHLGGGNGKDFNAISESGLYKLIMRTDQPERRLHDHHVQPRDR